MFEGGFEPAWADGFQYIADRAGLKSLNGVFIVGGRENHRRRMRKGVEMTCRIQAADAWHANVEQHDIGPSLQND